MRSLQSLSQTELARTLIKKIRALPVHDELVNILVEEFFDETSVKYDLTKEVMGEYRDIVGDIMTKIEGRLIKSFPSSGSEEVYLTIRGPYDITIIINLGVIRIILHTENGHYTRQFKLSDWEEVLNAVLAAPSRDTLRKTIDRLDKKLN